MKKTISLVLLLSLLLCGCSGSEERSWLTGQKALAEEDYAAASAAFEKAGSFRDSEQLLLYAQAWQNLENGEYAQADTKFLALGDFKDSVLMDRYCRAREREAQMQAAVSSDGYDLAVSAGREAYALFTGLSLFRDSSARATDVRDGLYSCSLEWMGAGRYEAAASGFEALGDWKDCDGLKKYCRASALEAESDYIEAAAQFAAIPEVLDATARAEAALEQAYLLAAERKDRGDYGGAAEMFALLGSYRDAEAQRESSTVLLLRTLLRSGSYAEALRQFSLLEDTSVFPAADPTAGNQQAFLIGFLNSWMNAHAGVMSSFFSCDLMTPYLIPGGELDSQIRAELTDDSAPRNYAFLFYGAEVTELLALDEGFNVGKVSGTASHIEPEGRVDTEETLWVLLDITGGNPAAAAVLPA